MCSMSRRGNCYDNAVMESFFKTVKSEEREHFDSCGEAKMALFDFIEVFYNQQRRHSTLGQISPAEYERRTVSQVAKLNRPRERINSMVEPSGAITTAAVALGLGHVDASNGAVVAVVSGGNVAPETFAKYVAQQY